MATKVTYPDKITGDSFSASEANQVKSSINSAIDDIGTANEAIAIKLLYQFTLGLHRLMIR